MKKLTAITLAFILILAFCNSCGPKGPETADLPYLIDIGNNISNIQNMPLSGVGQQLEYIPLETTPESLLERARTIRMTESFIFVSDYNKLVEFDREGKYIRTIGGQGRGPGEYLDLNDFYPDETRGVIYILTNESDLLVYGFDGKFIESVRLPFVSMRFLFNHPDRFFYYSANIPGQTTDSVFSWYITDASGKSTMKFVNFHKRVNRGMLINNSPMYMFNGQEHFIEFGSDTLLYLRGSKPEPYALFDFGKYRMDPDPEVFEPRLEDEFRRPIVINEDLMNLYITCFKGYYGPQSNCVFNKRTMETIFLEGSGFMNDLDGGLPFWPEYIYQDSILVDPVDAFDLINRINEIKSGAGNGQKLSDQLEYLDNTLTENSNPVLVILRQ